MFCASITKFTNTLCVFSATPSDNSSPVIRSSTASAGTRSSVHGRNTGPGTSNPFPRNARERRTYHGPQTHERQRRNATYNGPPPTTPTVSEYVSNSGAPSCSTSDKAATAGSRDGGGGFFNKFSFKFNRR